MNAHIAVVGSYATGLTMRVPRLPSTGETVFGSGYRVDLGGKGSNQAVGCARLGTQVSFVAKVGNDTFGDMALSLYREEGVDHRYVRRTSAVPTGVGFILVEEYSGENCIAIDSGANEDLSPEEVIECDEAFHDAAVVLTQLEISTATAEAALRRGRDCNAITILNPAPVRALPSAALELVDFLTPNLTEAKVLAGLPPDSDAEPQEVAHSLLDKGVRQIVMTLGQQGAIIVTRSLVVRIPATRVTPVDTTGAGDAFNAGLATALALKATLEDAVQFAVVSGGLAVTKHGVIPSLPYGDDIIRSYREQGWSTPSWFRAKPQAVGTRGMQ